MRLTGSEATGLCGD